MGEKTHKNDTISGMSVQDILDEIAVGDYGEDLSDIKLDDILAEFSDGKKEKKEKAGPFVDLPDDDVIIYNKDRKIKAVGVKKQAEPKKSEQPQSEAVQKKENKEASKVALPEEKKIEASHLNDLIPRFDIIKPGKSPIKEIVDKGAKEPVKEARRIERVVRPWEDGMYGDMPVDKDDKENKKKKSRVSKFTETFDTLTRSELFEEKANVSVLESRTIDEIMSENRKISKTLGIRTLALLILSVLSCYLAFAEPLGWFLFKFVSYIHHPFRYLFLTVFFQISAMLLSVDVLSKGLAKLFKLRPNMESVMLFSAVATLAHSISVMAAPHWHGWLPYSCISVLSLFFVLLGKWLNARALYRVCRVTKSSKNPGLVFAEKNYGVTNIFTQTSVDKQSFVSRINSKDASETFWKYLSPILIVSSLVFAVIASFGTKTPQHFFWALAGISCVSMPFFASMAFSYPFSVTAKGLASVGATISGWYSASALSQKANLVVRDRDIFPKGSITLNGLKVLGNYSLEKTVCYTASVIKETQSGLSDVFDDLLKSRYGEVTQVNNLRYNESGGIEAEIGGDVVLVGSAGFLLRSGVRLSSGTNTKNAVFIAINRQPAGVFNINYKANIDVERALHLMVKRKIPVILAVRDFNMLPMMVERTFNLKDNSLEYPEVEQRLDLSAEEKNIMSDAAAIVARSGLHPIASAVLASKKLRSATIRNVCMNAAASIIGMLLMFYLTFMHKPILITPHTVFVYMFLWGLPTLLLSNRVKK